MPPEPLDGRYCAPAAPAPLHGDRAGLPYRSRCCIAVAPAAAPADSAQTVEDFKAALSDIKRRLAEQRDSLQSGDQAAAVAEEAKAARGQIERLTRSMADLRRERDALRGQLLASRGSAEALQAKLPTSMARIQATEGGA